MKLIFLLLLFNYKTFGIPSEFRCPLEWVAYSSGDPLPETSVNSTSGELYGRIAEADVVRNVGVVKPTTSVLFVAPGSLEKHEEFQLATNPLGCNISWADSFDSGRINRVGVNTGGVLLGRVGAGSSFGVIYNGARSITYFNFNSDSKRESSNYNVMLSFSTEVTLTMDDFSMKDLPGAEKLQIVGMDSIANSADTSIMQSVSHTSTVEESVTVEEYEEKSSSFATRINAQIGGYGLGANYQFEDKITETNSRTETFTKTRSRSITSAREVYVPPNTSVIFCTLASALENYSSEYDAKTSYTILGWSGEEVREMLINENPQFFKDLEVIGKKAFRRVQGQFKGSMVMNTRFIVVPADAPGGCFPDGE